MLLSPRQKGVLLLFTTLSLAAGVFIFMFYFNLGNLNIKAAPPYIVKISGVKDQVCEIDPCLLKLVPREYVLEIEKEGYYPEIRNIQIKRFVSQNLPLEFQIIPEVTEMKDFTFFKFSKIPNNLDKITFFTPDILSEFDKFIPKNTKSIIFSPKGNFALFISESKIDIYDVIKKKIIDSVNKTPMDLFWSENESGFYLLDIKLGAQPQKLLKYDIKSGNSIEINYFPGTIEKARIFVSPNEDLIALIDESKDAKNLYIITNKWKKRIAFTNNIADLKWSPESTKLLVFSREPRGRINDVGVFDLENHKYRYTNIKTNINTAVWINDSEIIFSSNQKYKILNNIDKKNILIDILQEDILNKNETYGIFKYSYFNQNYQFVYQLENTLTSVLPDNLEYDASSDILYIKSKNTLLKVPDISGK